MDSHRRTIAKALTWRLLALITTTVIALAITGQAEFALGIGLADSVVKLGLYYGHERAWNRIGFGQPKPPDYQI